MAGRSIELGYLATSWQQCFGVPHPHPDAYGPRPPSRLVAEQERYEGSNVRTRGTVEAFGEDADAFHHVIEDDRSSRVQLLPNEGAKQFVGREVVVVGKFGFDEQNGRFIRVEGIETQVDLYSTVSVPSIPASRWPGTLQ
jgi:hypothetical protein